MRTLGIDIETFSSEDLQDAGVYKYADAPDFEILLFAYRFDTDSATITHIVDLVSGEQLPAAILKALTDPTVRKTAWNASFERICIASFFGLELDPDQWECTMVKASMQSYPLSLGEAAKVMKLDIAKDTIGKTLIRFFSIPCKPTIKNGGRCRNLPHHEPEKWQAFKDYCIRDVDVEQRIREKLSFFEISATEKKLYTLDQRINDRGVAVDPILIKNALEFDRIAKDKAFKEAAILTGLDNPNSTPQIKKWLQEQTGEVYKSLTKETIPVIVEEANSELVKQVLSLKIDMSKISNEKYEAMRLMIGTDGRVRGLLQFYGANRTGRWSGRRIQPQNLPKNTLRDLDLARRLVRENQYEAFEICFGNVADTLSQLIRTAFIPGPGKKFDVSDFSAIEARVISWLAGEKWKIDVFNTHGKIYEAAGALMFKVPIEEVTKGSKLRDKAKIAELALGFQGGPAALIRMGALRMGLTEEELQPLVDAWRAANPNIVAFWKKVGRWAIEAVENQSSRPVIHGRLAFRMTNDTLYIKLPSGRELAYLHPRLRPNKFGGQSLSYEGVDQDTKQWGRIDTYGGKLVENIVQGTARDLLALAMLRLDATGYDIVLHVHDETVNENDCNQDKLSEINKIMAEQLTWTDGLPLGAEGFETLYYKKD